MEKVLVIGAGGQLGTELVGALRKQHGDKNVVASDIKPTAPGGGIYEQLDALNGSRLDQIVSKHGITQVYHLAAILSAKGESNPIMAWDLNMKSLLNVLELGRNKKINRIFWPSSIAVYGPDTPKEQTGQNTIMNPTTVYGISKLAGEKWCQYYFDKYSVDVRSIRYPGLIGYKALPGGGTTDYAVDIFFKAIKDESFDCFLSKDTYLPMMYMDDAIRGTIELMNADSTRISIRTSYNLSGLSFSPEEIAAEIKKHYPDFQIQYQPDERQTIADSWPRSIDDAVAIKDWDWKKRFDLGKMTDEIIQGLTQMERSRATS